jgi:hypothetical protein
LPAFCCPKSRVTALFRAVLPAPPRARMRSASPPSSKLQPFPSLWLSSMEYSNSDMDSPGDAWPSTAGRVPRHGHHSGWQPVLRGSAPVQIRAIAASPGQGSRSCRPAEKHQNPGSATRSTRPRLRSPPQQLDRTAFARQRPQSDRRPAI